MITLGLNYSQMHDSSACLVQDGELLFAVTEERISRVKHDARFPALAIQSCLDFAKVTAAQVDEVCVGWQAPGATFRQDLSLYATGRWPASYLNVLNSTRHFASMQRQHGGENPFRRQFGPTKARYRFVDHHLAHALSSYCYSGFDDAAVVVMDGRGAWEATSIWRGSKGRVEHVLTINWPNSLGLFYAQFTGFLGFTPNADEWKVMGLAPYGQPGVDLRMFLETDATPYRVHVDRLIGNGSGPYANFPPSLGAPREPESEISDLHKNIAHAVQEMCEQAMFSVVRLALEKTGSKNLCLAGGVALNSKANGKSSLPASLKNSSCNPPPPTMESLSARQWRHFWMVERVCPCEPCAMRISAPSFDDDAIETALKTYKIRASRLSDPAATAAEMLSQGKILGWYQGRMEFGPRALGSRSILADPRDPEMNIKVNNAVKFREWWRPFAPSLKKEAASEYLESAYDSPFMILTAQVRPEKRGVIPSVTHVDGSARPQTVEKEINPLYYRLIDEFGKRTGVPVVMNTSFNLRGEAIVHTPTDAIRTFFSSGMDALLLGSFLVEK